LQLNITLIVEITDLKIFSWRVKIKTKKRWKKKRKEEIYV